MKRTMSEVRHNRFIHIKKRKNIIENVFHDNCSNNKDYLEGKLSKGKIHCSCPMCSQKTIKGTKYKGWKISDQKKLLKTIEA